MSEEIANSGNKDKPESIESPESKVNALLKQFEFFSYEKGNRNSFDISKFDSQQINTLLEVLKTNEDNAFKFHDKRLDAYVKLQTLKINAGTINQKTTRYIVLGGAAALVVITLLILFFKDQYFMHWLSFIFGGAGGIGLKDPISKLFSQPKVSDSLPGDIKE